jgi:NAD(P)H-hydrate epimerase
MNIALPAVTRNQMREIDRLAIEEYNITLLQMMELAGRNLAELAARLAGSLRGRSVAVLAGGGNNGGGGLAAARHAANRRADVRVVRPATSGPDAGAVAHHLATLRAMGIGAEEFGGSLPDADVYLDCLVGYSLRGPLRGDAERIVEALSGRLGAVISLDLPSGLDADRGASDGAVVTATATLTLALPKRGLLEPVAAQHVGSLWLGDIGIPTEAYRRIGIELETPFADDTVVRLD